MARQSAALAIAILVAVGGCDEPKKSTRAEDAAGDALQPPTRPAPEGCLRTSSLEGIERDSACAIGRPVEDLMRDIGKRVVMKLEIEPAVVETGTAAVARLTFTNVTAAEALLVFDVSTRAPGPRPDWSRLAGTPDVRGDLPETPRLHFAVTTLDASHRNVDAMPVVNVNGAEASSRVGVRLRPGGKLTHSLPWWALRIPAPAPIVKDDAGHRFVPKTAPVPLATGDYTITVDVPLHGVAPEERIVSAHVHVEAAPKPREPK